MALGWAIYGTWNWCTCWFHEILEHEMSLYIFLNTNNSNNTNVFWHTDLTDLTDSLLLMFEHEIFFEHEFYSNHDIKFFKLLMDHVMSY